MAATGFLGALLSGTLILVFGMIFAEPLALLCGSEKDAQSLGYATDYMRVILIGAPAMCSSLVLNNQLRSQGNATFAMVGLSSGAVINVLLDALLVPRYKVFGAAIATVACQYVSFFVLLFCTKFLSDNLKFSIKDASFRPFYLKEIFRGGFPSLCRQGIASVMNVSLMHCCAIAATAQQTTSVLQAAFGIVSKLTMFISSMMIGFGQGFQPVCGFNYGAGRYDRVREGFRFCVAITAIFLTLMSVAFFIFSSPVLSFMQRSSEDGAGREAVNIAVKILRRQLISLPLMSFVVMSNMMLQTTGNVVGASVLAMARQGLTMIPVMYLFFLHAGAQWACLGTAFGGCAGFRHFRSVCGGTLQENETERAAADLGDCDGMIEKVKIRLKTSIGFFQYPVKFRFFSKYLDEETKVC